MSREDLAALDQWLENREPLMSEFKSLIKAIHDEPWPDFVVTGLAHDMSKGVLKPSFKGVPLGSYNAGGGDQPNRPVMAELASRIIAVRSRRWYPITRIVRPINPEWQRFAREAFPFLCTMEIAPGWADLMIAASGTIAEIGVPSDFRSSQIKEKYGSLRWYYDGSDQGISGIIEAAEWMSNFLCEKCGAVGTLRTGGWMSTRCDHHFA